jgi:hypothetical protein
VPPTARRRRPGRRAPAICRRPGPADLALHRGRGPADEGLARLARRERHRRHRLYWAAGWRPRRCADDRPAGRPGGAAVAAAPARPMICPQWTDSGAARLARLPAGAGDEEGRIRHEARAVLLRRVRLALRAGGDVHAGLLAGTPSTGDSARIQFHDPGRAW